jgi:hypothetical protein
MPQDTEKKGRGGREFGCLDRKACVNRTAHLNIQGVHYRFVFCREDRQPIGLEECGTVRKALKGGAK